MQQDLFLCLFISNYTFFRHGFYAEETIIELVLKRKLTHVNNKNEQPYVHVYFSDISALNKDSKYMGQVKFSYFLQA